MNVRDRHQPGCCVHFTRGDKQTRKVGVARILILCGCNVHKRGIKHHHFMSIETAPLCNILEQSDKDSVYGYVNMWIVPSWILHIQ